MPTTLGDDVDSNNDPTIKQMARDELRVGRDWRRRSGVGKMKNGAVPLEIRLMSLGRYYGVLLSMSQLF
jgi:hypothetical protein